MKRAKLRGLKRKAAVVLGTAGAVDDVDVPTRALDGEAVSVVLPMSPVRSA